MPSLTQPSFAAGELAPGLHARVDLAAYQTGLRLCENFMVLRTGGATNRAGFRWVGEVRDSTRATVLIPFRFSTEQTYILEFGEEYIRFYKDGAIILAGTAAAWSGATAYVVDDLVDDGGTIYRAILAGTNHDPSASPTYWVVATYYVIATPYLEAELAELYYTQSADVLTLVHPDHAPMELSRLADDSWTLTPVSFLALIDPPTTVNGFADDPTGTGAQPVRNFEYVVTALNSAGQESAASTAFAIVANLQANHEVTLAWIAVTGAVNYNVYRGRNGTFGYVGSAFDAPIPSSIPAWSAAVTYSGFGEFVYVGAIIYKAIAGSTNKPPATEPTFWTPIGPQTFVDDNVVASLTDTPPVYADPFLLADAVTHSYPSVVAYYQQRLAFANSASFPEKIWLSRSGDYHNFGASTPAKDDDAIDTSIVANEVNAVRHLLSLEQLIALTSAGEWWITAGADDVLTPNTTGSKAQGFIGSAAVRPVKIGSNALFVQELGSAVRDLGYSLQQDRFTGDDLTVRATHLVEGHTIVDWAYAKIPHSVVWAVREDGVLLGLTYMREQEVLAWHHHLTDGNVERVAVITEGDEDVLYAVIQRTIDGTAVRYIERMETRYVPDVRDAFFVDAGLTYDGFGLSADILTLTVPGGVLAGDTVGLAGGAPTFVGMVPGDVIVLRYPTTRDGIDEPLDAWYRVTLVTVGVGNATGVASVDIPSTLTLVAAADWAAGVTTISGLDHLEGATVAILADGNVHPERTVSAGAITLQEPAVLVQIGLPYTAELETLDLATPQQTTRDKQKIIEKVTLQVEQSRGIKAGTDRDHMEEYLQPDDEPYDTALALISDAVEIRPSTTWNKTGRLVVQQTDPLPITVLSIIPSVVAGG